jgi:phosphatase NudJ
VPVRVAGVIRVEHTPRGGQARVRAVFLPGRADDTPPEAEADAESLGAAWVALQDLGEYPLRGEDARELFAYVAGGGAVCPPGVLPREGRPYRAGSATE